MSNVEIQAAEIRVPKIKIKLVGAKLTSGSGRTRGRRAEGRAPAVISADSITLVIDGEEPIDVGRVDVVEGPYDIANIFRMVGV